MLAVRFGTLGTGILLQASVSDSDVHSESVAENGFGALREVSGLVSIPSGDSPFVVRLGTVRSPALEPVHVVRIHAMTIE